MYRNWIEPIKEQLQRLEARFEQLSTPGPAAAVPKLTSSTSTKPNPSFRLATPSVRAASSAANLSSSDYPPTSDDIMDDTVDNCGM